MLPWCLAELVGKVKTGSLEVSNLHGHSSREVLTLLERRIFRHSHKLRQIQTDLALKSRVTFPYQSLITWTGFDLVKIHGFVATVAQILLAKDVATEPLCHSLKAAEIQVDALLGGFLCIFFSFQRM